MPDRSAPSAQPEERKKTSLAEDLYSWLQALCFALLLLIVVFTFFGRIIGVDGHSMDPTLNDRDLLLLQCIGYEPKQGDVVVLRKSFAVTDQPIVKRVIALGGQTVEIDYDNSTVYVDGNPLDEPYLGEPMFLPSSPTEHGTYWEVPEGSIFVMGDNRNASADSREDSLGPVDARYVIGHALCIIFPFHHIGSVA